MSRILLWFLKQLPVGIITNVAVLAGALQLAGIDLIGMGSDLLFDPPGVPNWSGNWSGSLL